MSGRGPTLAELIASNPSAAELLDSFCTATNDTLLAPMRCGLRKGHEGLHYDVRYQLEWKSAEPSESNGPVHPKENE